MSSSAPAHPLLVVGMSDVGLVRSENEDGMWLGNGFARSGLVSRTFTAADLERGMLIAVADGVGGEAAGDVASRFVLKKLGALAADAPRDVPPSDLGAWFVDVAAALNESLRERAESTPGQHGMATTLTGLYTAGQRRCWINAGDSRLYALVGEELVQISRDHTLREISGDPRIPGNIIVNCFGTENDFYLDTGELPVESSLYLLCSDGLSDYANPAAVQGIVRDIGGQPELDELKEAVRKLVDAAVDAGGGDNVTAVLVSV